MKNIHLLFLFFCVTVCNAAGCAPQEEWWHKRYDWRAEKYFEDERVIQLCHAIEKSDLELMSKLIADGADVNTVGKDGMTPLLWSLPGNKLPRFELLLSHGADPNVKVKSDLGAKSFIRPGLSVTVIAAKSRFPGFFEAVMKYEGDPDAVDPLLLRPLLHLVITSASSNRTGRIELLIRAGADLNLQDGGDYTPAMASASAGWYDTALQILEAGADPWCRCHTSRHTITDLICLWEDTSPKKTGRKA